jgi:Tol biopolymer transport system component/DNA-binding winged helix-turn-helix (wHTH) protein
MKQTAPHQEQSTFRFGAFELSPQTRELRKHGVKLKLQDQPLHILLLLLEHAGEIVTREEIQKRLWPENTYVDFDNAINSAIRKLRDALGDSPENPRFIETLARRGYRFIAPLNGPVPLQRPRSADPEETERRFPIQKRFWIVLIAALGLAIGAGVLYQRHSNTRRMVNDALPPPVPLTSYPGFQWSPSFSPDGTRVAFTWHEPGKPPGIYVKLIGPTDPVRLTSGEESDFAPVWSRDGRWIAFLRAKGPLTCAVMLIPSLGGTARELTRLQLDTFRFMYDRPWSATPPFLAWSSDGRWLLAPEQTGPEGPPRVAPVRIVRISVESGEKSPFLLSLDTDQNRRHEPPPLTSGEQGLALSPDGKKLAFIHAVDSPSTAVYWVPLTNEMMPAGPATSLHLDNSLCGGIAWDADGRTLIVSSNRRGSFELWRLPVSSSVEPSRISVSDEYPIDLAISKSGQRLAYTHVSQGWNIWRVDLTKGRVNNAAAFISSSRDEFQPSYSADGKRIAFESNRSGNEEIWVSDADGSHAVQVTSFGNALAGTPRWSPDGQQLAFDSNAAGQWNIYVIPAQGGKPIRFTGGSGSKIRPSWSHDGKWIYYCASGDSGTQIWKKATTGGAEVQVTSHGGCNQMESPDGRYLYYLNKDNRVLSRVPLTGGDEVQIAELGGLHPEFTLGKHGVYFIDSFDTTTLKFLDYATRSIRVIGTLPGPIIFGLTVSPDERRLLFGKSDSAGSQLMLVENFR